MAWDSTQTPTSEISYVDWNDMVGYIKSVIATSGNIVASSASVSGSSSFSGVINEYETATAGEALSAGDVCYLSSDGKYYKASASAEATIKGKLLLATEAISVDATGTFLKKGTFYTTGLTIGSTYFVSTTAGGITSTVPSTSGEMVRVVGIAVSTTELEFSPGTDYGEVA